MTRAACGAALVLAAAVTRAACGVALVLAAAVLAATAAAGARADTFAVVPSGAAPAESVQQPSPAALQSIWMGAGSAYGIPWQVLAAINKVESNFGRNMGPSSAGAIGWMQFMPSTWLRYGVDANGDGSADPWNAEDAVYAAARYLAAAGGRTDLARAIYAYNHADWYVNEVLSLAGLYGNTGGDAVFSLDQLQQRLDEARRAVARASRAHVAAAVYERRLVRVEKRLLRRAEAAPLLSDRLAARQRAVQFDLRVADAHTRTERASGNLQAAQAILLEAGKASSAVSFDPAAGTLLAAPSYEAGGYVFPVGGGPAVVSVSPTHHDYPAADIAAPMGAPVYALTDAVVLRAWGAPEGACGIGVTMQAADGRSWTYCHLSYLDPQMLEGAFLSAGQSVGLVGATGDATGPHLHLQLDPADSYPQQEAWFQAFAGSAFRWQGDPQTVGRTLAAVEQAPALTAGATFAVVQPGPVFEQIVEFTR